jgi:hypothetical protein
MTVIEKNGIFCNDPIKGKFLAVDAVRAYRGSRGISSIHF